MVVEVLITKDKLNVNEYLERLSKDSSKEGCGALVMFMGFVKGLVNNEPVNELIYEAYENFALSKMREISNDALKNFKIRDVVVIHRIGDLRPGDPTIYILVTARERSEAFRAAEYVLERVKHEVPISKLEIRENGEFWVLGDGRRIRRPKLS
ncbi:MAG: molybdenum cofactor biosynthesis protein MoaE [Desulfurococcaceae archaeon TW002]